MGMGIYGLNLLAEEEGVIVIRRILLAAGLRYGLKQSLGTRNSLWLLLSRLAEPMVRRFWPVATQLKFWALKHPVVGVLPQTCPTMWSVDVHEVPLYLADFFSRFFILKNTKHNASSWVTIQSDF